MSLTRTEYHRSSLLSVRHVKCCASDPLPGDVEYSEAHTLILPLHGVFMEHIAPRQQVLAEPGVALLFLPGQPSRISHPAGNTDDCLVFEFTPAAFNEIVAAYGSSRPVTHALLSPPSMAARSLIWRNLRQKGATPLEIEETGVTLLARLLRMTSTRSERTEGPAVAAAVREKIEETRLTLLKQPDHPWTLTSLADRVHASPFHLTRMFRKYTGVPLHQYTLHTRLARALDLLLETDRDLTTIALDLGFSSHSHFTYVFRRLTGLPPQSLRQATGPRRAAARQALLRRS